MDQDLGGTKTWAAVLKSAVQKHVRRGEVNDAIITAAESLRVAPGSLRKRWPVIVVEDALEGTSLLPQVNDNFLGVVAETASRPKNKEACGLYCEMESKKETLPWFGGAGGEVVKALSEGDLSRVARLCWGMWEGGEKKEVTAILGKVEGVTEILDRIRGWSTEASEAMLLMAGAVIAATGKTAPSVVVRPIRLEDVPQMERRRVAWYACDMHTVPGRMAMGAMLNRVIPAGTLTKEEFRMAWFWGESARLGGGEVEHRIWSWDGSVRHFGGDPEKAREVWKMYRQETKNLVRWAAEKNGIEVYGE